MGSGSLQVKLEWISWLVKSAAAVAPDKGVNKNTIIIEPLRHGDVREKTIFYKEYSWKNYLEDHPTQ